jgi:hypothetical protein
MQNAITAGMIAETRKFSKRRQRLFSIRSESALWLAQPQFVFSFPSHEAATMRKFASHSVSRQLPHTKGVFWAKRPEDIQFHAVVFSGPII